MSRFSRINTIWRKELIDTLRDRRTVIAMVLVPMVLYPALMLGSLQAFELQASRLERSEFVIAVPSERVGQWLSERIAAAALQAQPVSDAERTAPAGDAPSPGALPRLSDQLKPSSPEALATAPALPQYDFLIQVVADPVLAVKRGDAQVGLLHDGGPLLDLTADEPSRLVLIFDETDFRSATFAAPGLEALLRSYAAEVVQARLERAAVSPAILRPLELHSVSVATPERVGGDLLGRVVPLILIVMTIIGAMYPAIDLTAGERERGTLETLMAAPTPTVELIAGKFIVVTMIGMLSAVLNLASVGGTVFLGGFSNLITGGGQVVFPLDKMPWVLVVLIPLAVMFSALLLAVCSFARSFKEAQNYVAPVVICALIPAVVGSLPGTRLEGPMLVLPVTNIVLLTRELFLGELNLLKIFWVTLSTSIYAAASVGVAAKLFGQEAVLFADSGSVKTLFVRKFFKPSNTPAASQVLLVLALVYLLHFFISQSLLRVELLASPQRFLSALMVLLITLLAIVPVLVLRYTRVDVHTALRLGAPRAWAWPAALLLGASTWILAPVWFQFQQTWLPIPPEVETGFAQLESVFMQAPLVTLLLAAAIVPALVEEIFFRGYVLSGVRRLGPIVAVVVTSLAFAMLHHSVHRLAVTFSLGVVFALLSLRGGSIWPCVLAHLMHNGLSVLSGVWAPFRDLLVGRGWSPETLVGPTAAVVVALAAMLVAVALIAAAPPAGRPATRARPIEVDPASRF